MSGRRSSRRGASRGSHASQRRNPASALRAYAAGVASGLFIAFLIYLVTLPAEVPEEAVASVAPADPSLPRPSFDFYELLPQSEPEPELSPGPTSGSSAGDRRSLYLLQAGSFRDPADADRRRAELLLLGLEPAVEATDAENGRWYRVLLGPFESRSAMARARSLTAQQDIDTLLMRRSADGA